MAKQPAPALLEPLVRLRRVLEQRQALQVLLEQRELLEPQAVSFDDRRSLKRSLTSSSYWHRSTDWNWCSNRHWFDRHWIDDRHRRDHGHWSNELANRYRCSNWYWSDHGHRLDRFYLADWFQLADGHWSDYRHRRHYRHRCSNWLQLADRYELSDRYRLDRHHLADGHRSDCRHRIDHWLKLPDRRSAGLELADWNGRNHRHRRNKRHRSHHRYRCRCGVGRRCFDRLLRLSISIWPGRLWWQEGPVLYRSC